MRAEVGVQRGPGGADLHLGTGGPVVSEPNDSDETRVTVPLGEAYGAPRPSSASISQDHPTSDSTGSLATSSSTEARTKVTIREVPPQGSCPSGRRQAKDAEVNHEHRRHHSEGPMATM